MEVNCIVGFIQVVLFCVRHDDLHCEGTSDGTRLRWTIIILYLLARGPNGAILVDALTQVKSHVISSGGSSIGHKGHVPPLFPAESHCA